MDDGIARMGEIVFSRPGQEVLKALGLGSCIGLCIYDPAIKLSCLVHIMLPQAKPGTNEVGKYADTAVPHVIKQMIAKGAKPSRMLSVIAGGAQLFSFHGADSSFDVGKRNTEAVKKLLSENGLKLAAEDVGGKSGRTMTVNSSTGEVTVRSVGGQDRPLARLLS